MMAEFPRFYFLVTLMLAHLVADFFLQPRKMGRNKSKSKKWMLKHVLIHVAVFTAFTTVFFVNTFENSFWQIALVSSLTFAAANGLCHMLVDLVTWRLYALSVIYRARSHKFPRDKQAALRFKYWEDHWFYVTIGVDQFLHIVHILLVYKVFYG